MLRSLVTKNYFFREFHNFAGILSSNSFQLSIFTNSNILKNIIPNIVNTQQPFYKLFLPKSAQFKNINQYSTCSTRNHRFSATDSGLRVNYSMEFEDVKKGLSEKTLVLIDVRNPDELVKHGKIPGSINIPCKFLI